MQETVEWSHDFDRMIGCVLFCCSRQTFKMSTSELLDDQSKRTKIKWMCLMFCPEVFYHHWSSGLWLINNYGVREELSWGHINRGKGCCNFTSKSLQPEVKSESFVNSDLDASWLHWRQGVPMAGQCLSGHHIRLNKSQLVPIDNQHLSFQFSIIHICFERK